MAVAIVMLVLQPEVWAFWRGTEKNRNQKIKEIVRATSEGVSVEEQEKIKPSTSPGQTVNQARVFLEE